MKMARFIRFGAALRLGAAILVALLAFIFLPSALANTRWLICWDIAIFVYLGLAWQIIRHATPTTTREHVISQDQSGYVIFLFVVSAACAGLVAIGFMVSTLKGLDFWPRAGLLTLSVLALLLAWLLIHTVFAFHYARLFYVDQKTQKKPSRSDLDLQFPGESDPDYYDFAYYSFVVGMTSQVSDVVITSKRMRRLTLLHSILSFIFNITVFALSINIIASVI